MTYLLNDYVSAVNNTKPDTIYPLDIITSLQAQDKSKRDAVCFTDTHNLHN